MNKYSDYKLTHIDWLGKIPSHWILTKNRFGFKKKRNGDNEEIKTNVLSLTTKGIKIKKDLTFGKTSASYIGHQLVKKGDLVFTPRDFDQTPILSDVSKYDGCISNLYIVDEVKDNLINHYVNYFWYGLKYSVNYFKNFSHGMRYSFNRYQFDEIPILIPPIKEQKLITSFLDKKINGINLLIEKIYRKIELLKKQRTLLINQSVTKGLDLKVEMKHSGVEWIGKIPKHWDKFIIRYLTEEHRQGFYTSDPYDDEGIPILRITDIQDDHSLKYGDSPKYNRPKKEIHNFLVKQGDFLFPRTGGVGRFGIIDFDQPCIYGSFLIRFRWKKNISINFLKFFFQSNIFQDQVKQEIHGGVNQNVHVENIKNCLLFKPSLEEQKNISNHLEKITSKIDKKISLEKSRTQLLSEYCQSLISSVVTGKVRIREDML